jgi:hypothetical protein
MVHKLSKIVRICVGSVKTIIHNELNFTKFSTCWVPKMLSHEQKKRQVQISGQLLDHYEGEDGPFLHLNVMCDEI